MPRTQNHRAYSYSLAATERNAVRPALDLKLQHGSSDTITPASDPVRVGELARTRNLSDRAVAGKRLAAKW